MMRCEVPITTRLGAHQPDGELQLTTAGETGPGRLCQLKFKAERVTIFEFCGRPEQSNYHQFSPGTYSA